MPRPCTLVLAIITALTMTCCGPSEEEQKHDQEMARLEKHIEDTKRQIASNERALADLRFQHALEKECDPAKREAMKAEYRKTHPDWSSPPLVLLAWSSTRTQEWVWHEGQIKNVATEPMSRLRVFVEWYTKDGTFITSEDGYTTYDPVMPGQTSPYKVMMRWNPEMFTYRISFETSDGTRVDYDNEASRREQCRPEKHHDTR